MSERPMPGYSRQRKEWFLRRYWSTEHRSLFVPNGILHSRDLVPKLRMLQRIIERDGKVLDLGCGNGLLLKCLLAASKRRLVPYGVDFLEQSVRQARTRVLPRFRRNFSVGDALRCRLRTKFDYIIADPECAPDRGIGPFFRRCCAALAKGGTLVFLIEDDSMRRLASRKRTLPFLRAQGLSWVRLGRLVGASWRSTAVRGGPGSSPPTRRRRAAS